jgi:hypothetical protein
MELTAHARLIKEASALNPTGRDSEWNGEAFERDAADFYTMQYAFLEYVD